MSVASTWLDLVVGIDLHYEVVPASPTPVPFPHPFVGVVWDPVGAVVDELVSATVAAVMDAPRTTGPVLINGRLATATGDEAKMPFGHMLIPPGVSWFPMPKVPIPGGKGPTLPEPPVPPPGNAMLVFGSKTVEMRGGKAVRLGDKALSCSDPVRLPTSFVVPVGGPQNVLVGGPATIDWVVLAFAVGLGALRTKRVAKLAHGAIDRFVPKSFRRARDFLHDAACFVTGHPVNVVNGSVLTTWVDFALPGPLPLRFTRRYRSSFCSRDSVVGHGWSHNLDQQLWIEPARVVHLTEDGRELEFDTFDLPDHVMRKGDEIFDPISRFTLRSLGRLHWELRGADGLIREFGPIPGESPQNRDRGLARLTRIRNRAGQAIELRYDDHARLVEVVDAGGRVVKLGYDRNGRLASIALPAAEGEGWREHAQLRYSAEGDLVETRDALGQAIRFEYEQHTLVRETDRNGLSFYFTYDGWGPYARCTRTWGDGGIYDHEIAYDVEGRRSIVEDSLGHCTVYEWGPHGVVAKIVDARGGETCFEHDELLRVTAKIDRLGNTTRYGYDERGNQVVVIGPDKATTTVRYDENDDLVSLQTPRGAQWRWTYDRRGRRLTEINPLGECTRYRYEHGRLVAVEDTVGAYTSLHYDSSGNVTELVRPGGTRRQWSYDALGRVVCTTDPRGNAQRRQYDVLGRVIRVDEPDGNVRLFEYDGEGNVVRAQDRLHSVALTYQGLGRLVARSIAGTTARFEYDTEERIVGFVNDKGHAYRFERDGVGNVKAEVCFDGSRRTYERDAAGHVTKVHRPGIGRSSAFEHDPVGRVTKIAHHDGSEEVFVYDADGALVEADNDTIDVHFERDLLGRIIRERQGEQWVSSRYDHRSLRVTMESSLGVRVNNARDAKGGVVQMSARLGELRWETELTRDVSGLAVDCRFPGLVRSYWWRDSLGRPTQHWVGREDQTYRSRRYDWSLGGQIMGISEAEHAVAYHHDSRGHLIAAQEAEGPAELRVADEVGNVYRTTHLGDRDFGRAGELLTERSGDELTTFSYDAEGNLLERGGAAGSWAYHWDGAGRLARADSPEGWSAVFSYDALGRRVEKRADGRATRWVWDGDVPLHEATTGGPKDVETTWLFRPDGMSPIGAFTAAGSHSIVTDHLDVPLCVVDDCGAMRWRSNIDIWGQVDAEGDGSLCPWRFPGQYADRETGLHYNRFRYYDPSQGVYISRDPIGLAGGTALYAYVPDPLSSCDPVGLSARPPCLGLGDASTSPWLADPRMTIASHLERFRHGGSFLIPDGAYRRFVVGQPFVGTPGGQFIIPYDVMDDIVGSAQGSLPSLKRTLGIPDQYWNEEIMRIDIHNPLLHNARLPSGLEIGANEFFRWGGYTSGGAPEVVVDRIPLGAFTPSSTGIGP